MAIKVLLWQTIDKLGKRGEQVSVADGYARNYLYPRHLATPATSGAAREFKASARKAEKVEAEIKKQYSDLASQVGNAHVSIEMLSNAEGVLFGSVTPSMVADALKRSGLDVNAKFIQIEAGIKNLGEHMISVRFHPEVQAKLKVTVVPSKAEAAGEVADEENPFTKGISVDEAERGDPKNRGRKRPRKDKEGEKKGEAKKEGGAPAAASAGEGAPKAEAKAEAKPEKAPKAEKPAKADKK